MKYIFFSRRISDVDHITPVIYSLIISGVKSEDIYYYDIYPDITLKNIHTDERINFLKKK